MRPELNLRKYIQRIVGWQAALKEGVTREHHGKTVTLRTGDLKLSHVPQSQKNADL